MQTEGMETMEQVRGFVEGNADKSFKSTGTIRVRIEKSGSSSEVFFTPNDDSTVRCGGKKYAVFSRTGEGKVLLRSELLSDPGEGVSIKVADGLLTHLTEAAVQQKLVEVEVEADETLTLRAITIPAPGK